MKFAPNTSPVLVTQLYVVCGHRGSIFFVNRHLATCISLSSFCRKLSSFMIRDFQGDRWNMKPSDRQHCSIWTNGDPSMVLCNKHSLVGEFLWLYRGKGSLAYLHHPIELEPIFVRGQVIYRQLPIETSTCNLKMRWGLLASIAAILSAVSSEYSTTWMTSSMCETKLESSQVPILT